jgi:hypothetical protein
MDLKHSLISVSIKELGSALLTLDSLLLDENLKSYEAQEIQSRAHDLSLWVYDIALAVRRRVGSAVQSELQIVIRTERVPARDMSDFLEWRPERSDTNAAGRSC